MSEDDQASSEVEAGEAEFRVPSHVSDWANLVRMANENELETGLTLSVGGAIISGTIISGVRYFQEFGNLYASGITDPETSKQIADAFAGWGRLYQPPEGVDPESFQRPDPNYIHLRDARFFGNGPTPIPNNKGMVWRGKISAVDGFSLGTLSQD